MSKSSGFLVVGLALALVLGCGESRERPWDEALPTIFVQLDSSAHVPALTKVAAAPAPEIRFLALLQPDPNHVVAIEAPVTGVVVQTASPHQVRRGETLTVMREGAAGREVATRAPRAGNWRALHAAGQSLWQGDTIGLLDQLGYMWAVGQVGQRDARIVDRDDPATVLIGDDADPKQLRVPGRVESVRGPGMTQFSADVAVEIRTPPAGYPGRGALTVVVQPTDREDSLAAVPASAVVQLPLGTAVFVPAGPGRYEVRWVVARPPINGRIVVREGVRPGATVVARDLGPLLDAARDSLLKRPVKAPR